MSSKTKIALVLVAAAAAAYWFWPSNDSKKNQTTPPVEVIAAYEKTIQDRAEALGTGYANESADITASVSEYIAEIAFTDGQQVKKDDVIVRLEQSEEQAQLRAAQIQKSEHERELNRLRGMLKERAAAQREVDERLTQLKLAEQVI